MRRKGRGKKPLVLTPMKCIVILSSNEEHDEDKAAEIENRQLKGINEFIKDKPKYRIVVYLHYYEGYQAAEIGKILKLSESTVRKRLERARKQLKELIEFREEG